MVFEGKKGDGNFKKDRERNMWCKTDGEKENRGPDGDVRIEGNSGSDGKGEWSEMVWHVLRRDDRHWSLK